jgi:hypothetical protein
MSDPEKHTRYLTKYKPNDLFWGIGIENETYLQFSKPFLHPTTGIHLNHRPERYSVNYYVGLDETYKHHIKELFPLANTHYQVPIYVNSHTFQKTDASGNHQTTYEKVPQPNPQFSGKTIHEILCEANPEQFEHKFKVNYTYDGDTLEFMTQNFYKAKVNDVIKELIDEKTLYIKALNQIFNKRQIFNTYGSLIYPLRNEPFVTYLTNLKNVAIFNNGTYHINLTLPTQLGSDAMPIDNEAFVQNHKSLIRYIQLLEPFLIAIYGTPDPFSEVSPKYSRASQRCAVSRYIGIGTYDTDSMLTGKILNMPVEEYTQSKLDHWWYNIYNKTSNYIPLPKIGVDINFKKHGVHGIEIRFLEWFPEERLKPLMNFLVHLCDYSLKNGDPGNPVTDPLWNGFVVRMLQNGKDTILEDEEFQMYKYIFKIVDLNNRNIEMVFKQIESVILSEKGICVKYML